METTLNEPESTSIAIVADVDSKTARGARHSVRVATRGLYRFTCKAALICRVSGVHARGDDRLCNHCGLPRSRADGAAVESGLGERDDQRSSDETEADS